MGEITVRHVCYVTGTRADFGLVESLLRSLTCSGIRVSLCVTGMHLSAEYGYTIQDVRRTGLAIDATVRVDVEPTTGGTMARATGAQVVGLAKAFQRLRPTCVLLLGDRGEMLAGAIAALYLNIPVVHLHGGERSGTVDESIRHAISKLAHYHFVSTEGSRRRLIRMGEDRRHIFVTGAPGLDGVRSLVQRSRTELCQAFDLDAARKIAVLLYHPVVQTSAQSADEATIIAEAVLRHDLQVLWLLPNSDSGSSLIRSVVRSYSSRVRAIKHVSRADYVSWLAAADVLVGNSSSGIVEAASLGIPVVNVGSRQNLRERNRNVFDVSCTSLGVYRGVGRALRRGRRTYRNIYGDGAAVPRVVRLLQRLPFGPKILFKCNSY